MRLIFGPAAGLLPEVAPETPVEGNSPEAKGARENMKLAQHSPLAAVVVRRREYTKRKTLRLVACDVDHSF